MLKMGLSHGVAVIPNPPKVRYTCPLTGAHFKYEEICLRIEGLMQSRILKWKHPSEDFAKFNLTDICSIKAEDSNYNLNNQSKLTQ